MAQQLACPVCPTSCEEHSQEEREALWRTVRSGEDPIIEEAPPDASDPNVVGKGARAARRREAARKHDLEGLIRQKPFRVYIAALVARHRVFEPESHPGDTHATALAMGERNVVLRCLSEIRAIDPTAVPDILSEALNAA